MILSAYARARDFVPEAVYTGDLKFIPTQLGIPALVTMFQAGKCATKPARFWELLPILKVSLKLPTTHYGLFWLCSIDVPSFFSEGRSKLTPWNVEIFFQGVK